MSILLGGILLSGCATGGAGLFSDPTPQMLTLPIDGTSMTLHRVFDAEHPYGLLIMIGCATPDVAAEFRKKLHLQSKTPILVWDAKAQTTVSLYTPQFQFTQESSQFTPNPFIASQMGVIQGDLLAPLREGSQVLGYIVMPEGWDYTKPVNIFHGIDLLNPSAARPTELMLSE